MNYGAIKNLDIANGPGIRVSLFVSGCRNNCPGCFNKEAQDFDYGEKFTNETWLEIRKMLDNPNVAGLSILGGDPFEPENIAVVETICQMTRIYYPDKTIWVWTGYCYDNLAHLDIMRNIDVLVDGPFIQEEKDLTLYYRGSRNQRVINVPKSLKAGRAIRLEGDWR